MDAEQFFKSKYSEFTNRVVGADDFYSAMEAYAQHKIDELLNDDIQDWAGPSMANYRQGARDYQEYLRKTLTQ